MLDKKDLQNIEELLEKKLEFKFKIHLKPIKSDLAEIRREVKQVVYFFDHEYLELRSRVERIEEILNLKSLTKRDWRFSAEFAFLFERARDESVSVRRLSLQNLKENFLVIKITKIMAKESALKLYWRSV